MTASRRIAVLFQAAPSPTFGGVAKPPKPNGYRDSAADITYALKGLPAGNDVGVITPVDDPNVARDDEWSFPDTAEGISSAIKLGANVIWANTVLHRSHPLFRLPSAVNLADRSISYIGQVPGHAEDYDDKTKVNDKLRESGLREFFPRAWTWRKGDWMKGRLPEGLHTPCVLKPVRGRGSHGVVVVHSAEDLAQTAAGLFAEGDEILVEEFLEGEEVTMSVMPPGEYDAPVGLQKKHWSLPVIRRFNHQDFIAPYSGSTPVTANSKAVSQSEFDADPHYATLSANAARSGALLGTRGLIRIDCRRFEEGGRFGLFDINMKPNATGPGRPGRDDQLALTGMAAEAVGWDYPTFLKNLLQTSVDLEEGRTASDVKAGV